MKKLIFLLAAFSLPAFLNAQSFEKGDRIFDIDLGFAVYSTNVKDNQDPSAPIKSGKAAGTILAPAMEWATGKRISIGISLLYSRYLSSKDSASGSKPTASGLDADFIFNFHFVKSKRVDLFTGFKLGMAGFRLAPHDGTKNIYGSTGSAFDLHIGGRFYVSRRIGIIANLGFPHYTFSKFGNSLDQTYTLKFNGVCIGTGIAIKLGSKNTEGASSGGKK
ncbi:MAG: hypothetical protein ACHQHP_00515 [Bacteroidia bacterium]